MMFNTNFDNGYAWGGTKWMTLDGAAQVWSITWEPPWGYADISVIAHEMGHGFGLPHSSGAYGQTYDNAWDVMSQDRYNCAAAEDPTYGCMAQHTISFHKDRLGWIPAGQKFNTGQNTNTTITLEQLALPTNNNYKMAQIPIGGSSTHFYTVEVRQQTGYDAKVAGNAVIIHEVDTTRGKPAYVIDADLNGNTADAGAMWTVGETFSDIPNNISVSVVSATSTGFQVTIQNGGSPAPGAFNKSGPANGATNQSTSPTLTWTASTGALGYEYCYDTTNDNVCPAWTSNGTSTSKALSGLSSNTTYYWHVRAVNTTGTTYANGFNTAFWSFKTTTPPGSFNKSLPANNAIKQPTNIILTWGASAGATGYEYCCDTTNNNTCDTSWASATTTTVTLSRLTNNTIYYWQVRAVNANGTTEASSGTWWNFKVVIAPPTLALPLNAVNVNTKRPSFDWEDVSGSTSYTIEASTSPAFFLKKINATVLISSYTPTLDLTANTLYYWRVKANGTNGPGGYSEVRTFTTGNPPSVPTLRYPASNALVTTLRPLFDWSNSAFPAGTTFDHYQIQITISNTFASPVIDATTALLDIGDSGYTPIIDLAPATTYYWRVRSFNTNGDFSGWSAVRTFRTQFTGPILVLPANLSMVGSLKPTFTWNPIAGATSYNLQVSKSNTFPLLVINKIVYTPTYTHILNLTAATTYYWRVRVNGAYGPGAWSLTFSFTIP
jgi:hypothetical protein